MKAKRLIKNGGVAKRLIRRGHIVVDTAPQRDDPSKSVFIFFCDRWLKADIDEIMEGRSSDNATLNARLAALGMTEKQYRKGIFEEYLQSLESEAYGQTAG